MNRVPWIDLYIAYTSEQTSTAKEQDKRLLLLHDLNNNSLRLPGLIRSSPNITFVNSAVLNSVS